MSCPAPRPLSPQYGLRRLQGPRQLWVDCVEKVLRAEHADFLRTTGVFDALGRGDHVNLGSRGSLPTRATKTSHAKTRYDSISARFLPQRHFRLFQHNRLLADVDQLSSQVRLSLESGHSITAHYANEPSLSDQAPPMQRATISQLSSETALPNRSRIAECRRKSQNIVALVPREPPTRRTAVCP